MVQRLFVKIKTATVVFSLSFFNQQIESSKVNDTRLLTTY